MSSTLGTRIGGTRNPMAIPSYKTMNTWRKKLKKNYRSDVKTLTATGETFSF